MRLFPVPLLLAAGCAPGTVVTVQPNAIPKTALDGEWFWRRTVEDAPYGTSATFVGAQDQLERVVFDIEEELLVAYRSIPHIDGLGTDRGAPLLVFPITDQFDIRRAYDHTTGEESNVVEENREAPWYDRDYIRVDFSVDLSGTGFTSAGQGVEVLDWVSGDDRAADAPQLDDTNNDGVIDSLLVTQHALAAADTTYLPGWGDVPVCLFYGEAEYECEPSELDVVHSFVRTGQRPAYQGLAYDDRLFDTFGYFTTDRIAYDPDYGLLEPNRVRWANRHPLFEEDVATDDDGRILCTAHGDEAPCDTFTVADNPQVVPIPYADRTVRQVVYHTGPGFPADLIPVMTDAAAEWNEPLRDAINGLREWECLDGGGRDRACNDLRDEDLEVFVFCPNNPSLPSDPDVCSTDHTGPDGHPDGTPDPVRVGDLRYHLAEVVPNPQISSPFGYGPSAADPVGTRVMLADGEIRLGAGEIVSANAFVYEHVLDRVSTQVADLVALINGEIPTDAFVAGEDVAAWVEGLTNEGSTQALVGRTEGVPDVWTQDAVAQRATMISNGFSPLIAARVGVLAKPTHPSEVNAFLEAAADAVDQSGVFGAGVAQTGAAWDAMVAGPYDDLAWSTDTVAGAGFDPETTTGEVLTAHSPFDAIAPDLAAERELGRVLAGQNAVDLDDNASFTDSSLLGLARYYAELGLSREEIIQDVRENVFYEVMLHEVGHTLGLRHNFSGSADAFNYRKEYWDLRNDGNLGPRHVDPETDTEIDGRIREYQYSTVMDYPGSRNVGWSGLGHYDLAAIKFGYAQLVEVLTELPAAPAVQGLPNDVAISYIASYASSSVLPSVLLWYNDGSMLELHYTDWPSIAGNLEARADVPFAKLDGTLDENGTFASGLVFGDEENGVPDGAPAVPYRFCSDEFATGMTCARFDEGADPYETVQFLTERYWNDYVLTNFARNRYGFGDASAYVQRLQDRTFEPLRTWQRYYALFHGLFGADTDPLVAEFFAADKGWGGWTAATDETLRFLTQVIARPEPGAHAEIVRPDNVTVLSPGGTASDIPLVQGAYFESDWDYESGYHWFEQQSRIGTYFDRMLALVALTNTASYDFIGYDTAIDPRAYAIGFQDLYRDPLHVFVGRLMADEVGQIAPARDADGTLVYRDPLATDGTWPPAGTTLVEPATYWLVRFDAALFGLSLMNHGYDRTFLDRARIYLEGSDDAVVPPAGQATVSFVDPLGGGTFTAWSFTSTGPNGDPVELGAGASLLKKAQHLADLCDGIEPATDPAAACAEMERMTSDLHLVSEMYGSIVDP